MLKINYPKAFVRHEFQATVREVSIDCYGFSWLCLVGKHINGYFFAELHFGLATELSGFEEDIDNIFACLKNHHDSFLTKNEEVLMKIAEELYETITPLIFELDKENGS